MKMYLGIITDNSGSMRKISKYAADDYNALVESTKTAAMESGIDTVVSVIECGGGFKRTVKNSSVIALNTIPRNSYRDDGYNTPLYDSVHAMIDDFMNVPDKDDPNVVFVIMATTDGYDQGSHYSASSLSKRIELLETLDRWTITFRVPTSSLRSFLSEGFNEGNILTWNTTEVGLKQASTQTTSAVNNFYSNLKSGVKSSRTFYSSMKDVTAQEVKSVLTDISSEVTLLPVSEKEHEKQIRDFVEDRTKAKLLKGAAFYQLVKAEDKVQASKLILIRDKSSNAVYHGAAARDMLGLPKNQDVRVKPADHGNYDVFVQSTSVNRKVSKGTNVIYWPAVGVHYKEGKSA